MKLIFLLLLMLTISLRISGGDRITGQSFATRSEVYAVHGMAATSHPLATEAALEILRAGGSALGLMEPTGNGIGGDLFAIVWDAKEKKLHGYNGSGRSPRSLTLEKLRKEVEALDKKEIPAHGALPISVPGCVDGWTALHGRFGVLPLDRVLAPAIRHAREGFPVTELISHYWRISARVLADQPGFLDTFTRNGKAPRKGEIWTNSDLARTLEKIGSDGRDGFYKAATTALADLHAH